MHLAPVKQPLQQDVSLHPRALTPKTSRNVVGWGGGGDTCNRLTSHSEEVATLLIDNAATSTTDWLPISPNDIIPKSQGKWSPTNEALGYQTNSPYQQFRKFTEISMENKHTDVEA